LIASRACQCQRTATLARSTSGPHVIASPNAEAVIRIPALLLVASLLITGCQNVRSIHAFIPDSAATNEDQLLGRWVGLGTKDSTLMTLVRRGPRGYMLSVGERASVAWLDARFARVGGKLLLDLRHTDSAGLGPETDDMMITTHMLVMIEHSKDRLLVRTLDDTRLTAALEGGRIRLSYTELGGDLILTGTTDELWGRARDLSAPDFWDDPTDELKLHRLASP